MIYSQCNVKYPWVWTRTKMKMKPKRHLSRETLGREFHPDPFRRRWRDWLRLHRSLTWCGLQTSPRGPCSCWMRCPGREASLRRSSRQWAPPAREFPDRNLGASQQECQTGSTAGSTNPTNLGLHLVLLTWDTWTSTVRGACLRPDGRTVSQKPALRKSASEGYPFIMPNRI